MKDLLKDIKFNCDVSDAGYWGYFSICGLLMRYRDLFRSEQGLEPWDPISREDIARWIGVKEGSWAGLEGRSFRDLDVMGAACPPFDLDAVNAAIRNCGLVYGAGYAMYGKPTFFLADIRSTEVIEGHTVYTVDRELVRDLFTAPAMLQEHTIFLRLEPLKALLWDKFTEIRPERAPALNAAYRSYGISPGLPPASGFGRKFEEMALSFSRVLLHHELAESKESVPQWKDLLMHAGDRKTEHFLRAVQDLVADTSDSGPIRIIAETQDQGALGLFIGLLDGFRRHLFPEIREAYNGILQDGSWSAIDEARRAGHHRFRELRLKVIDRFSAGDLDSFRSGVQQIVHDLS